MGMPAPGDLLDFSTQRVVSYVLSCLPAKLKAPIRSRQKARMHAVVFASDYASRTTDHPRGWRSICRGE